MAGDPHLDELTDVLAALSQTVAGLASTAMAQQEQSQAMAGVQASQIEKLSGAAVDRRKDLQPDKPKLTSSDATTPHAEMKKLHLYMNGHRLHEKVHWMTGARTIATDRALVVINSFIVNTFQNESNYQRAVDANLLPSQWLESSASAMEP